MDGMCCVGVRVGQRGMCVCIGEETCVRVSSTFLDVGVGQRGRVHYPPFLNMHNIHHMYACIRPLSATRVSWAGTGGAAGCTHRSSSSTMPTATRRSRYVAPACAWKANGGRK